MMNDNEGASPSRWVQYSPRVEITPAETNLVFEAKIDPEFLATTPYDVEEIVGMLFNPDLFDGVGHEMDFYYRRGYFKRIRTSQDDQGALIIEITFRVPNIEQTLYHLSRQ